MNPKFQTSDALRSACGVYLELLGRSLPSEEKLAPITSISDSLEQRVEKLFQQEKKFYFYWLNTTAKRVACILVILFMAVVTTTFSVEALRDPFIQFIVETFEKGSRLLFPTDSKEDQPITPLLPSYIPKGFSLSHDMSDDVSVILHYQNEEEQTFSFTQWPDGTVTDLNTEDVSCEKLLIAEKYEGLTFCNDGIVYLSFATEQYLFNLEGTISAEELLKIAESIPFGNAS